MSDNDGNKTSLSAVLDKERRQVSRSRSVNNQNSSADFDKRAQDNVQKVAEIHEFRRGNIQEYVAPDRDLLDYDPEEKSRRYDALKAANVFKYESTYKSVKWAVAVGCMFSMHRFYRTRDLNNAAFWFSVMSSISFLNIWASHSLQEFATGYNSVKAQSHAQRGAHQRDAMNVYVDKVQNETTTIDNSITPVHTNERARQMNQLIESLRNANKSVYGTNELDQDQVLSKFFEQKKIIDEDPQLFSITQEEFNRFEMLKANKLIEDYQPYMEMPIEKLEKLANSIIDRASRTPDNAQADPDATYYLKL